MFQTQIKKPPLNSGGGDDSKTRSLVPPDISKVAEEADKQIEKTKTAKKKKDPYECCFCGC